MNRNPWSIGSHVKEISAEVSVNIEKISEFYPEISNHIDAFDEIGSRFIFARKIETSDYNKSYAFALIRFTTTIESTFGITQEVPIIYLPYFDLQKRSFAEAIDLFKQEKKLTSFEKVIFFSRDPKSVDKIRKWSAENIDINYALIFNLKESFDEKIFIRNLSEVVYSRNLFEASMPVEGNNFFGRGEILQKIQSDIDSNKCVGIFGLRKSGKTSIINEIQHRNQKTIFSVVDLEHIPFEIDQQTPWIIEQVGKNVRKQLIKRGYNTSNIGELEEVKNQTVDKLQKILSNVLRKLPEGLRLCLVFDEIEHISPNPGDDGNGFIHNETVRLLGMLRYLNQNNENINFIICGLSNSIVKKHYLNDRNNPVFSYTTDHYLGPMSLPECNNMAQKLSSKMAIQLEENVLDFFYDHSAGHPYMYRVLAKLAVDTLNSRSPIVEKPGTIRVLSLADAENNIHEWKFSISGIIENNRMQLGRYYVHEFLLLEFLEADDYSEFLSVSDEYGEEMQRLIKLGAIFESGEKYKISKIISTKRLK